MYQGIVRRSRKTFAISNGLIETAVHNGLPREKFALAPDGVDLAAFEISDDPIDSRRKSGLPADQKIVLYTGKLSDWKGADVLVRSVKYLPEQARVLVVGGLEGEPEKLHRLVLEEGVEDRVDLRDFVPHSEIPALMKAADVVVLPNKPNSLLSTHHTSPLKLFEYMAAKRPIVASDLPSIREIVDDDSAVLVPAGDPEELAKGIRRALQGGPEISRLVDEAYRRVSRYSWEQRAKHVLSTLGRG